MEILNRSGSAVESEHSTSTAAVPWSGRLRRGKLHPPQLSEDTLPRQRLLRRLASARSPLTIVVAPAGFGKTTFAAQWAAERPHTAWLTADHRDDSLDRFWAHWSVALTNMGEISSALGAIVTEAMTLPHRAAAIDLGRMLADEFLDLPGGTRLVIDDLHLVSAGEVFEFLAGLLDIAPPGLELLVTSRLEPPLPLSRMRMRGILTEVRGDDLLFTELEIRALLEQHSSDNAAIANPHDAPEMRDRTRGWPTALRLAVLAAAASKPVAETEPPPRGSGPDREVLTWLLDESLAGRPPPERAALMRAALPRRFNPRLLQAMTVDLGAPHVVRDAIDFATRSDLCRASIRYEGDWLDFHPLFRDALLQQLLWEEAPESIRALHARAARWLEENGHLDQAITHLLAAGEVATAGEIVLREIQPAFNREDWPAVARWLAKLPAEVIQKTPRLLLAQGLVAQLRGQPVPLAQMQTALEAQLARGDLSQHEAVSLRAEFDSLRVNVSTSDSIDLRGWLASAERAMRRIDPAHRYELGVAWMHLGMALAAAGKHQEAIARLEAWIDETGSPIDAGSIRGYLGLAFVHVNAGSLKLVETTARTMIALAEQHRLRLSAGWGHFLLGAALYEMNDLDGAIEHYSAAARDHEYFHLKGLREALFGLALSYRASGRHDEAGRALRRSREIAIAAGVLHQLPIIDAQEAFVALLTGDTKAASLWAHVHNPAPSSEPLGVLIHPTVIRATILCASTDPHEIARGLASLDHLRQVIEYWGYSGLLIRVNATRAVALLRQGDRESAVSALRASCGLARENGHIRPFLDLLPTFSRELDNLSATVMLPTAVQQILRQPASAQAATRQEAPGHLPLQALTERELEVLGYLVQRFSYSEIGDELYISPHTVKRHVTSIYSKLDVSGRHEAIDAARELGWFA